MRESQSYSVPLGGVVDFARTEITTTRDLVSSVVINGATYVPSLSANDIYAKTDIDSSLIPSSAYMNFASLSESLLLGTLDANSPFVASIGSGAAKISVYSIVANSQKGAPTIRASSSGLQVVYIDSSDVTLVPQGIGWSIVSNGSKFFAYPVSSTPIQKIVKTSVDGITWTTEQLSGDYPDSFPISSSLWRWYYNIPQSGYGFVPSVAKNSDFFVIGSNFFLIDENSVRISSDGLFWTNITTSVYSNTVLDGAGMYTGINSSSAFVVSAYGIRYTTNSGGTWTKSPSEFINAWTYGYTQSTLPSKFLAKSSTAKNVYYVTTNTGATWTQVYPGANSDFVMYKGSTIVLMGRNTGTALVSTDDGSTFTNITLPASFTFPIKSALSSTNYFYAVDSVGYLFRSSDGITWTYLGYPNVSKDFTTYGRAITISSTVEIIISMSDASGAPYIILQSDGASITAAKLGSNSSSIVYPNINSNTDVLVCNAKSLYASKITFSDLASPPYVKLTNSLIPPVRDGMTAYIRVG